MLKLKWKAKFILLQFLIKISISIINLIIYAFYFLATAAITQFSCEEENKINEI